MVDVKPYYIVIPEIEEGAFGPESPKHTIQGATVPVSEEELEDWDTKKQSIIKEFLGTLWSKGDKGTPSGRQEWKGYVKVELPAVLKKRVPEVEVPVTKPPVTRVPVTKPPERVVRRRVEVRPPEYLPTYEVAAEIPEEVITPEAEMEDIRRRVAEVSEVVKARAEAGPRVRAANAVARVASVVKTVTSGIVNRIKSLFGRGE